MKSDDELTETAVHFVLAMMQSASTDTIRPIQWWERARAALETSAAVAESWPQMVSKFAQKIQVIALRGKTSHKVASLGPLIGDDGWERFRSLCQRDALYIVAMAQAKRDELKGIRKTDEKHYGTRAIEAEERLRETVLEVSGLRNRIAELEADNQALKGAVHAEHDGKN